MSLSVLRKVVLSSAAKRKSIRDPLLFRPGKRGKRKKRTLSLSLYPSRQGFREGIPESLLLRPRRAEEEQKVQGKKRPLLLSPRGKKKRGGDIFASSHYGGGGDLGGGEDFAAFIPFLH